MDKPESLPKYRQWLAKTLAIDCDHRLEGYYDAVTQKLHQDFNKSDFWNEVRARTAEFDQEYLVSTSYPLFAFPPPATEIFIKPFNSFLDKTFRKNVIQNDAWPSEPPGGWFSPRNCFSRINDLIRTTFAVKYLDGVDFLLSKLETLANQLNLLVKIDYEARDEGYYAGHFNVLMEFSIPKMDWDSETITVPVEIQITTQLQEVIRRLLHKYYETHRLSQTKPSKKWQWNYRSEAFTANYLGHILHYIEGTILEVRDKQKPGHK